MRAMVEYGNGLGHGGAGQVGGGGGSPIGGGGSAGSIDVGSSLSNTLNDAVNTFSAMPLAEQVVLVLVAVIVVGFILRRVF